jgi:hypothetical protein
MPSRSIASVRRPFSRFARGAERARARKTARRRVALRDAESSMIASTRAP